MSAEELGKAWDRGFNTAAHCYWRKPRNPFTGEMNDDDPEDYCPAHGGTGTPEDCNANPLPFGQPCPGPEPRLRYAHGVVG